MNCLEFRYRRSLSPDASDRDLLQHERGCPACARNARELRELERHLARAVQVPVPRGLEWRILARQSLRRPQRRRWYAGVAIAASLVAALVVVLSGPTPQPQTALAQAVVSYLAVRPAATAVRAPITQAELTEVMEPLGLQFEAAAGPLSDARPCRIRGQQAAHLVIEGEKGPIDVLVMPAEQIRRRHLVKAGDLEILVVPCPRGSMAIVGRSGEALSAAETWLRGATVWL